VNGKKGKETRIKTEKKAERKILLKYVERKVNLDGTCR
jgi:hypothetical protein